MKSILEKVERIKDHIQGFIEAKIEEGRLESIQTLVEMTSKIMTWAVIGVIGFFTLSLLTVVAGLLLSTWMESYIYGFGTLTLFYLLVLILFVLYRGTWLETKIQNILYGWFIKK